MTRSMRATGTSPEAPPIPLFDLRLEQEDLDAVADALRSGWLTMGPRTHAFEVAFAERIGARHAVAVSSCTAALHLAYLAAGVGPGDEVIVPSFTMAATASPVVYEGATPVFADIISLANPSLDPDHVRSLITPRTKAVTVVHFAGYPAPVDEISELCTQAGIALIEDAAHAPLARLHGRALGTWGFAGAFSFFSNKILSGGEGGLLCTDDVEVATFARSRRSHAMTVGTWQRHQGDATKYDVVDLGYNYRIDDPRCALLLSRLRRIDEDLAARRRLTDRYRALLADVPGLIVPFDEDQLRDASCYVMPVMVADASRRDAIRIALRTEYGVQTSLFYPPVHSFTAYRERFPGVRLPVTEQAGASEITLPLFPHLTDAQQDRVIEALAAELAG
jgi:dTDP-4-amino-4,6-dideoxygalactose transaminase